MRPEQEEEILRRIASGEAVVKICADAHLPGKDAVYERLAKDGDFADKYARAREAQADVYAQEIVDIADTSELSPDDRRVKIDARKWAAGKLKPKKYGDRIDHNLGGEIGVKVQKVVTEIVDPLDDTANPAR